MLACCLCSALLDLLFRNLGFAYLKEDFSLPSYLKSSLNRTSKFNHHHSNCLLESLLLSWTTCMWQDSTKMDELIY